MKKMTEHFKEINHPSEELFSLIPPLPEKLSLELNNTCNLNCVFCPFHSPYLSKEDQMTLSHMDPAFAKELLKQAAALGIGRKELGLFATGEIFLYQGFDEILRYARGLNAFSYIYLTTNGILATPENIRLAVEAGVDSIRFSINAGNRSDYELLHGKDCFETVLENLKEASAYIKGLDRELNLSVSCVLTKKTLSEEGRIRALYSQYVDDIIFIHAGYLDGIDPLLEEEYAVYGEEEQSFENDNICGYVFNSLFIDSNGIVRLCCSSQKALIPIVDLKKEPDLKKAWEHETLISFRKRLLAGETKGTVCEKCLGRCIAR